MVSPLNDDKEKTTKIIGDGKKIIMRRNSDSLFVIGSGNIITVDNNEGFIKIVGDGCKLSVENGTGSIEYNGDGGYLKTGKNIKIKYKGDGGKIVQYQDKKVIRSCEDLNQKTKKVLYSNVRVSTSSNFIEVPIVRTPDIKLFVKKRTN